MSDSCNIEYHPGNPNTPVQWYCPDTERYINRPMGYYYRDKDGWVLGPFSSANSAINGYNERYGE